jgi:Rieske Fe-S protein
MNSVKPDDTNVAPRRGFIKFLAIACGGLVTAFPFLAGIGVFLDPIRRRQPSKGNSAADLGEFVRVAALQSVPADGIPRQFPVIADQHDAWTFFPEQRIGSVFLRRDSADQKLQCFTSICPHAGCSVSYAAETESFLCPCHSSQFALDGQCIPPTPSPRGMDPLEVRVNENDEILVKYVSYLTGTAERKQKR